MKYLKVLAIILSLLVINSCCDTTSPEETGLFPDPNFEKAIREALDKPEGEVTKKDLQLLYYFYSTNDLDIIMNISGIEHCVNLEDVYLSGTQIEDLSPISNLLFLHNFYLISSNLKSLSSLKGPTYLNYLDLRANRLTNISGIKNTPNLKSLDLGGNLVSDSSPLKVLKRLQHLSLRDNKITSLPSIKLLTSLDLSENRIINLGNFDMYPNLKYLYLYDNQITDISTLADLNSLGFLGLGNNQLRDISPIMDMNNLTGIDLENNLISDISSLSSLNNLRRLNLLDNKIIDFTPLKSLTNLTSLEINNSRFDLSLLSNMNNLSSLRIDRCKTNELSALSAFDLYYLSAVGNKITSIEPLKDMRLGTLILSENEISDISFLKNMVDLSYVDLRYNHLIDIKPLVDNNNFGMYGYGILLLNGNSLNQQSIEEYIPILEKRGVEVYFGDKIYEYASIQNNLSKKYVHPITGEMVDEFIMPIEE